LSLGRHFCDSPSETGITVDRAHCLHQAYTIITTIAQRQPSNRCKCRDRNTNKRCFCPADPPGKGLVLFVCVGPKSAKGTTAAWRSLGDDPSNAGIRSIQNSSPANSENNWSLRISPASPSGRSPCENDTGSTPAHSSTPEHPADRAADSSGQQCPKIAPASQTKCTRQSSQHTSSQYSGQTARSRRLVSQRRHPLHPSGPLPTSSTPAAQTPQPRRLTPPRPLALK